MDRTNPEAKKQKKKKDTLAAWITSKYHNWKLNAPRRYKWIDTMLHYELPPA